MVKEISQFRPQIVFTLLMGMMIATAFLIQPRPKTDVILVEPIVEVIEVSQVPDFAAILDVQLRKQTFFAFIQPHIDYENAVILRERESLIEIQKRLSSKQQISSQLKKNLMDISVKYKVESRQTLSLNHIEKLLSRADIIPSSLVLAQAANESAWGSSRFARQGRNFFGQWCYRKGCGLVPSRRLDGAKHEIRRFATVRESVHAYFMNLNTFRSYEGLRDIRQDLRNANQVIDGISLTQGLLNYSERGEEYIGNIQSMIYSNNLLILDEGGR